MRRCAITMVALLAGVSMAIGAGSGDDQVYFAADEAPVVWVRNGGSDVVTFKWVSDSAAATVTVGTVAQTIADGSADDVNEIEVALKAITNSSGQKVLEVYRCAVLGTESTDDELIAQTITLQAGEAGGVFQWDTSDVKHYRVFIPPKQAGSKRGTLRVLQAYGDCKGTGNVTLKAYLIKQSTATEKYMTERVSPLYRVGAVSANTTTSEQWVAEEIMPGLLDGLKLGPTGIVVGGSQGFLLSADRATTGTTGGVGVLTSAE